MPKCISWCTPAPVCWREFTMQRPASGHTLQSILAPCWCKLLSSSAVTCENQGGLTVNWQGIKSRTNRCSGKGNAEAWPQLKCLSQKSRSHSHAKGHFLHSPPPRYAGSQFSTVYGESGVSTLITARLMSFKKAGGHPLHQRKRHLTETGPPFSPLGSLTFPGHRKQTSSSEGIRFQCGKKKRERERTGEGQDVFTLGWMPTIRETSVLSEKVKASERPLVQLQIQATACTQRTLSLDSTELPAPSNLLTLFPRSPLFSRELTLCSYDEHLLRSSQCLAPEPSFVVGKEDSETIGPIV